MVMAICIIAALVVFAWIEWRVRRRAAKPEHMARILTREEWLRLARNVKR